MGIKTDVIYRENIDDTILQWGSIQNKLIIFRSSRFETEPIFNTKSMFS